MVDPRLTLRGERVCLRSLRLSDVPEMVDCLNKEEISRWTLHIPFPYTEEAARSFIQKKARERRKRTSFCFAVVPTDGKRMVGVADLFAIDPSNLSGEIGYWLAMDRWNQGLMTGAVALLVAFSFRELQLHKLNAKLFAENAASARVLEKNGFLLEGRFVRQRFRYGDWHDVLHYGLMAPGKD